EEHGHPIGDYPYDEIHDDGTHSDGSRITSELDELTGVDIIEPDESADPGESGVVDTDSHNHTYEHTHGSPEGGASFQHLHVYDHNHRFIEGDFDHDHLISKHLNDDQEFEPAHDDLTHSGATYSSDLGFGMVQRHNHEYEHEHGNDDRGTDVLHDHSYSHEYVITALPLVQDPGHSHTISEHLRDDNEFDIAHDDGTHSG
ncbi:MAG: hypothetical protein AB8E87_12225, partial [Prochlorococcus sp.]